MKVPALENRPALTLWTAGDYEAFQKLSSSRPLGMGGAGSIPISEISAYCALYRMEDLDDVDRFVTMIKALDSEYLQWMHDKSSTSTGSGVAGSKVPAARRGRTGR